MTQRNEPHDDISRYEFSGIEKRHGIVPAWLAVVYGVMFVWMVFYLVRFWTARGYFDGADVFE